MPFASVVAPKIAITVNGERLEIEPVSVAGLLEARQLAGKRVAVERNGAIVPKSRHASTALETGDGIEIVVAVGGG